MDYKDIEKKAYEFTKIYSELPIPVCEIAQEEGLEVYKADFGDDSDIFSGFCDFENKEIYVNRSDSPIRQFFVTAHELGHWILHRGEHGGKPHGYAFSLKQGADADSNADSLMEREADYFAVNLIMPSHLIKRLRNHYVASDLAEMFNVSRTMMEKRLNGDL